VSYENDDTHHSHPDQDAHDCHNDRCQCVLLEYLHGQPFFKK